MCLCLYYNACVWLHVSYVCFLRPYMLRRFALRIVFVFKRSIACVYISYISIFVCVSKRQGRMLCLYIFNVLSLRLCFASCLKTPFVMSLCIFSSSFDAHMPCYLQETCSTHDVSCVWLYIWETRKNMNFLCTSSLCMLPNTHTLLMVLVICVLILQ